MKKVLIITYVPFWRQGAGSMARIKELAKYLGLSTKLTIIYAGVEEPKDSRILSGKDINYELIYLERIHQLSTEEYILRLKTVLSYYHPDVCIVEFLKLSFITKIIPKDIVLILDTHDLISEKGETFKDFGYEHAQMQLAEEIEIFKLYDKVMLIQSQEYQKVRKLLGREKVLLIPHPIDASKKVPREKVKKIGFIGSSYEPNSEAMMWFLENVQPLIKNKIELHIYGRVCNHLQKYQNKNVFLHGFVDSVDVVYDEVDIIINPVRFGAGLKIKNIEALGKGMPLITTSHGASGIEDQMNKSFLVADSSETFLEQIDYLIKDYEKRFELGALAHQFVQENFSPEKCFEPLAKVIHN